MVTRRHSEDSTAQTARSSDGSRDAPPTEWTKASWAELKQAWGALGAHVPGLRDERALKHFVHQAFILADREIDAESLRPEQLSDGESSIEIRVGNSIAAAEKLLITATLNRFHGNKGMAASVLGISLKTLYARLSVYKAERSSKAEPTAVTADRRAKAGRCAED